MSSEVIKAIPETQEERIGHAFTVLAEGLLEVTRKDPSVAEGAILDSLGSDVVREGVLSTEVTTFISEVLPNVRNSLVGRMVFPHIEKIKENK